MGTTLEVLAPYLPYGIEIEMPGYKGFAGGRVPLESLRARGPVYPEGFVYGLLPDSPVSRIGQKPSVCLPVLRPFADLCTPLEDGTVPADEIRQLWGLQAMNGIDQCVYNDIVLSILNGGEIGKYAFSVEVTFEDVSNAIDYLRSKHFAVGLTPEQYIRKA